MMTRRVTAWMEGRRRVNLTAVALTLVLLLASAAVARPVAAGDTPVCPSTAGSIPANDSDQEVGTFAVAPADGAGDVTVTLSASELQNPQYSNPLISVTFSAPPTPGGVTSAATVADLNGATITKTFSTASSVRAIVGGPSGANINWFISSEGGGCIKDS